MPVTIWPDMPKMAADMLAALTITCSNCKDRAEDPFYAGKVKLNKPFSDEEPVIASFVKLRFDPATTSIMELGCGYGQLSLVLACVGFHPVGVDVSKIRYDGAIDLQHNLIHTCARPEAGNAKFLHARYPQDVIPMHNLFVATNVVSSAWDTWNAPEADKYTQTLRAQHVILDTRLWWIIREDPKDQVELVEKICKLANYSLEERITTSIVLLEKRA